MHDHERNKTPRVETPTLVCCFLASGQSGASRTVAGNGTVLSSGDGGPRTLAGMSTSAVAVDVAGNIFIADGYNNRVRKVAPTAPSPLSRAPGLAAFPVTAGRPQRRH
ncbi:MAG: hypothetical protein ABSH56_32360 [Bryobacteraceae bacterium]